MDKFFLRNKILETIAHPEIPTCVYEASDFGIYPSEAEIQTVKLQSAMESISERGGGQLRLPSGVFYTGALSMKSKVELCLSSEDTVLRFTTADIERNYPLVYSHWEATPCMNFSPLIYADSVHDISISGHGIIDGGADSGHWWNWHHQVENTWSLDKADLQREDRNALRLMNEMGVSVRDRVFGAGHYLRPSFIQVIRSERILIEGVRIINSPMWVINPVLCRSVIIDGVRIESFGPNNDGCDPESCNGVWIKNCTFDTGDDCISLKSGRDRDGREINVPCENVLIEHNLFSNGHGGIALGSEMSGGIRKVLAIGNEFTSPNLTYALRLKTNAKRGGFVEEIIFADTTIKTVSGAAIHGTMLYEDGHKGSFYPVFRNISIENLTSSGGDYGIFLEAFEEVPIVGLVLKNIHITGAKQSIYSRNWKNPHIENLSINGTMYPRPEHVWIQGVPIAGDEVRAGVKHTKESQNFQFIWESSNDGIHWQYFSDHQEVIVPHDIRFLKVTVKDDFGYLESSIPYIVLDQGGETLTIARVRCRGGLERTEITDFQKLITKDQLMRILYGLFSERRTQPVQGEEIYSFAKSRGFLPSDEDCQYARGQFITRQELASIAMQACGASYKNASSTMPVCGDIDRIKPNFGTNIYRALYFGFMQLEDGKFYPEKYVTVHDAIDTISLVADFAGL